MYVFRLCISPLCLPIKTPLSQYDIVAFRVVRHIFVNLTL